MRSFKGWSVRKACTRASLVLLALGAMGGLDTARAAYTPTPDELALLAYANLERADRGKTPFIWHDGLGEVARKHSDDVTRNECFQHDSCNGQVWWRRVQQYYPGWVALGENISGGGSNPRLVHEDWMASDGHRANILGNYTEFGAGISFAPPSEGSWSYSTEDFGSRGAIPLATLPTLPAGAVVPRLHYANQAREIFVNYFHHGGAAPRSVRALIGSSCVNLTKIAGSATNGTYGTTRTFSDLCTPVVFEAIRSDGTRHRWPETGAVVVGVGSASVSCPHFTATAPTQDCGGGGGPLPTPTPDPGPGREEEDDLSDMRVVLKPGKASASKGVVQVQATLPAMTDFDPTSAPVSLDLTVGTATDWSVDLPSDCGGAPCLKGNRKGTAFHGKYEGKKALSFVRADDRWKVRFSARDATLGSMQPGRVTVTLTVDGRTFSSSMDGRPKENGIVAE